MAPQPVTERSSGFNPSAPRRAAPHRQRRAASEPAGSSLRQRVGLAAQVATCTPPPVLVAMGQGLRLGCLTTAR